MTSFSQSPVIVSSEYLANHNGEDRAEQIEKTYGDAICISESYP